MIVLAILLAASSADPVSGTWEGSSLCQVKPSPCHDEHVIYRIKNISGRHYHMEAYKVVGGEEQYMGPLDLTLDETGHHLDGSNTDRSGVVHPWLFVVNGTRMSGRALSSPGGQVFRLIEVTKR